MIRARKCALLILATVLAIAIGLAVAFRKSAAPLPPRPANERPTLLLLTSLPLVFGDNFSVRQNGSPALEALETRYRVVPISVTDPAELAKGKLVLMAHPLPQPAEDLVSLDQWVRHGGRVLLLADPMLEWPSERPLGDPLRPPAVFMDTGLLAHWGLSLEGPVDRGPTIEKLDAFDVLTVSPGRLSGSCAITADRLVARCKIEKGDAIVIADADLLDVADLGAKAKNNLEGVLRELADLEKP